MSAFKNLSRRFLIGIVLFNVIAISLIYILMMKTCYTCVMSKHSKTLTVKTAGCFKASPAEVKMKAEVDCRRYSDHPDDCKVISCQEVLCE